VARNDLGRMSIRGRREPLYGPTDSISRVLASALLAPALSPVVFSVVSPFISISILPARRVRLSVPIVVVVRFMVCIDSHPVTISEDEPRRRLRTMSPVAALEPIIFCHARIEVDFVVGIVIVAFQAPASRSFRNDAAGSEQ